MAFWQEDRDWDNFFKTQPKEEVEEWLKLYDNHYNDQLEQIEEFKECLSDLKDAIVRCEDHLADLNANVIVLDRIKDSAEWKLDQPY